MHCYRITGGKRLSGDITVGGSKNAALPILFSAILSETPTVIENLPDIRDVHTALNILKKMGAVIRLKDGTAVIDTHALRPARDLSEAGELRAGVYLLGACLSRFGEAEIPLPGGCDFGNRPIDYHLAALRALGAEIAEENGRIYAIATHMRGAHIVLPHPSVGATVNALLAAVTAEGVSVIENAAAEPHITDLITFLRNSGAHITGDGTSALTVRGVPALKGTRHRLIGDMIEAGTYLYMGAATGGCVKVNGVDPGEMTAIVDVLSRMGCRIRTGEHFVTADAPACLCATSVVTAPYPGFPTDMQPLFGALLTAAEGTGKITEKVWKNRFRYVGALQSFGVEAAVDGSTAVIRGGIPLKGADVIATDLRGGAALILAALTAEGVSHVGNAHFIARGYEKLAEKLCSLGADVTETDRTV